MKQQSDTITLEKRISSLEKKLDLLLNHFGLNKPEKQKRIPSCKKPGCLTFFDEIGLCPKCNYCAMCCSCSKKKPEISQETFEYQGRDRDQYYF